MGIFGSEGMFVYGRGKQTGGGPITEPLKMCILLLLLLCYIITLYRDITFKTLSLFSPNPATSNHFFKEYSNITY